MKELIFNIDEKYFPKNPFPEEMFGLKENEIHLTLNNPKYSKTIFTKTNDINTIHLYYMYDWRINKHIYSVYLTTYNSKNLNTNKSPDPSLILVPLF